MCEQTLFVFLFYLFENFFYFLSSSTRQYILMDYLNEENRIIGQVFNRLGYTFWTLYNTLHCTFSSSCDPIALVSVILCTKVHIV